MLTIYKNRIIKKEEAIKIVIKFAMQNNVYHKLLDEIIKFKPYNKGNDDPKFLINYLVGVVLTHSSGNLNGLFDVIATMNYSDYYWVGYEMFHKEDSRTEKAKRKNQRRFWYKLSNKWAETVGKLEILPTK